MFCATEQMDKLGLICDDTLWPSQSLPAVRSTCGSQQDYISGSKDWLRKVLDNRALVADKPELIFGSSNLTFSRKGIWKLDILRNELRVASLQGLWSLSSDRDSQEIAAIRFFMGSSGQEAEFLYKDSQSDNRLKQHRCPIQQWECCLGSALFKLFLHWIFEAAFAIRYDSETFIFHHTPVWGTLYLQT